MDIATPLLVHRHDAEPVYIRLQRGMRLVPLAARLVQQPIQPVQELAYRFLALPQDDVEHSAQSGLCGLNYDQSPCQLCLSLASDGTKVRLIADPASYSANLQYRYERSIKALRQCVTNDSLLNLNEAMLHWFGPGEYASIQSFTHGVLWLAAGLDTPGRATYVDTSIHETEQAWDLARQWLQHNLPTDEHSESLICAIAPDAWLSSVSVEGIDGNHARLKVYFRLYRNTQQGALEDVLPLLDCTDFIRGLALIMTERSLSYENVLFSVGFAKQTGQICDTKLDAGVVEFGLNGKQSWDLIQQICDTYGYSVPDIEDEIMRQWVRLSFIGLGVTDEGRIKCNLYLKPGT